MQERKVDILVSEDQINRRIGEIAAAVDRDFAGDDLVVVGVLKGSFIFMADLVRRIKMPLTCDFLRVSSYSGDVSTGTVRMDFDMTQPVLGKSVLLVEDIVDTGRTLRHLIAHMEGKGVAKLKVASLLYKETGAGLKDVVSYIGFEVPDRYVIGYGLDSEGLYRSLPYVGAFK